MNHRESNILLKLDWLLIVIYLVLVIFGWFSIYATTLTEEFSGFVNLTTLYGKQAVWILMSLFIIILILAIEASFYERFASVFYSISILFLLGLFLFGNTIKGQTNWYSFAGVSLQPAEFVKSTTALAVAKVMSDNLFDISKLRDFKNVLLVIFIPFFIIILLPDIGSAIVFLSFIFVLLREKMPTYYFSILFISMLIFIITIKIGMLATLFFLIGLILIYVYYAYKKVPLFFRKNSPAVIGLIVSVFILVFSSNYTYHNIFKKHHKDRLALWLRLEKDATKLKYLKRDYGYNNDQSVKAIATGGLTGKGFLEGDRTNGNFVPEQHTDYIFSAIGEEFGFIGTSIVVILFMILILRIIQRAEIQRSRFARIYGYGVASILFFHFVINIGMVTDLLPTVGIPLPFFSYGGSSLWAFTILLFIFIKLDSNQENVL